MLHTNNNLYTARNFIFQKASFVQIAVGQFSHAFQKSPYSGDYNAVYYYIILFVPCQALFSLFFHKNELFSKKIEFLEILERFWQKLGAKQKNENKKGSEIGKINKLAKNLFFLQKTIAILKQMW